MYGLTDDSDRNDTNGHGGTTTLSGDFGRVISVGVSSVGIWKMGLLGTPITGVVIRQPETGNILLNAYLACFVLVVGVSDSRDPGSYGPVSVIGPSATGVASLSPRRRRNCMDGGKRELNTNVG